MSWATPNGSNCSSLPPAKSACHGVAAGTAGNGLLTDALLGAALVDAAGRVVSCCAGVLLATVPACRAGTAAVPMRVLLGVLPVENNAFTVSCVSPQTPQHIHLTKSVPGGVNAPAVLAKLRAESPHSLPVPSKAFSTMKMSGRFSGSTVNMRHNVLTIHGSTWGSSLGIS